MQSFMLEEGFSYYETPFRIWLSHTLNLTHKRGGNVVLLSEYEREKQQNADDLISKMEKLNKEEWQN